MKQTTISVDIAAASAPIDPEMFLCAALVGLNARAGLSPVMREECEGVSVPGLPWDHPMNRGLFAMQKELREAGVQSAVIFGAVCRFTALCSPVVTNAALAEYVDHDEHGNVVALTEFLIRAAATATLTLGDDKLWYLDPSELAAHSAAFRARKHGESDANQHGLASAKS